MQGKKEEKKTIPLYKISVLIFVRNSKNELLLLKRNKPPHVGCWTPIAGKLHMAEGESPFECAIRESYEEAELELSNNDLHLFSIITEKSYEGNHWLLFLFDCKKTVETLPKDISEGSFQFFSREAINNINIPKVHKEGTLWEIYDNYRTNFVVLKGNFQPQEKLEIIVEEHQSADLNQLCGT